MRIGWAYLYGAASYPPDWFAQELEAYLDDFLPRYAARYLHLDVTVEPTGPVVDTYVGDGWLDYFVKARSETTWGYDSMIIITDAPFRQVSGSNIAGTNYYLAKPNFAWTSVRNWEQVDALAQTPFYQGMPEYMRRRYALMYGDPANPGISALAVAGHEISHYLLLRQGGPALSAEIDGGRLSGMAFLDDGLHEVQRPVSDPPNWSYVAQRLCPCLSCQSGLGAYPCGRAWGEGGGRADPDTTVDVPLLGPIDVTTIATWTIIFAIGGVAAAGALRLAGLDGR